MNVIGRLLPLLLLAIIGVLACFPQLVDVPGEWIEDQVAALAQRQQAAFGPGAMFAYSFEIKGLIGVILVSLICGIVSSLVVTNRMAFFSDALAHCAFAGVALGLILYLVGLIATEENIMGVTILFGVVVGLAIAFVREQTNLASDTIIGVFFAGAMGFGAVLLKAVSGKGVRSFSPENFLFGDLIAITGTDLLFLALLLVAVLGLMFWWYNQLVFMSFNPSLARSRRVPIRFASYLFIVFLALVVNVSLKIVGVLLINALLVLPAATAGNLSRNLRQFFWLSIAFSVLSGLIGMTLTYSWVLTLDGKRVQFGLGGMIVVVAVLAFFLSIVLGKWVRGQRASMRTGF